MSDKHATLENRDGFQSKWGFILACIGSAVGMGNIWRFPIMVQQFGGMTFLIPYFLFVLLIGSTGIIEEFALGRWAQGGPVISFGKATEERTGNKRLGEAIGAPVSYCSAECGSADTVSERVYMASDDGGEHWYETGRCPLAEGSFLNAGFADGRLVGLDVGRVNAARTGWCDYIAVRESTDGGSTWTETARLLEGCAVYLWRLRRLRDGSLLVLLRHAMGRRLRTCNAQHHASRRNVSQ